jgi:hypothetical protein
MEAVGDTMRIDSSAEPSRDIELACLLRSLISSLLLLLLRGTLNPEPYTLQPRPQAPHPPPYTSRPIPYTLHPAPCTLGSLPGEALYPKSETSNAESDTRNPGRGARLAAGRGRARA